MIQLPKLADIKLCTGCTACQSICPNGCIEMLQDEFGFRYPQIINPTLCISCRACEKVCPVIFPPESIDKFTGSYAAMSNDLQLRLESSSGGIFSELAINTINSQGRVYGAVYDEDFNVKHYEAITVEELKKMRGAKYSESNIVGIFPQIKTQLNSGIEVLFIGTPCQVAGLKRYLGKEYNNLLCVDFICHGIPSPMVWSAFVDQQKKSEESEREIVSINLRSKDTGWSKYQYSNCFFFSDGNKQELLSTQSIFMKLFTSDYISRNACERCLFKGFERCSDITLGDFWGIWDIAPEMDDNKGTSVVLIHSEKGEEAWALIQNRIRSQKVSLDQVSEQNPSVLISSKSRPEREKVLRTIKENGIESCKNLFIKKEPNRLNRLKHKIKTILKN